jgi:hypothetical protein
VRAGPPFPSISAPPRTTMSCAAMPSPSSRSDHLLILRAGPPRNPRRSGEDKKHRHAQDFDDAGEVPHS